VANIVIADRDPTLLQRLAAPLAEKGHQVIVFEDVFHAWDHLSLGGTDLLVTDIIHLPGQPHGIALANHAARYSKGVRTVFITADPDLAHEQDVPALTKSVDPQRLSEMLA